MVQGPIVAVNPQPNRPPARHSARFLGQRRDRAPPTASAGPRRQLHQPRYPSNGSSACRGGERVSRQAPAHQLTAKATESTFWIDSGSWIAASNRLGPHIGGKPKPGSGTPAAEVKPTGSSGAAQFAACAEHPAREPTASGGSTQRVGSAEEPYLVSAQRRPPQRRPQHRPVHPLHPPCLPPQPPPAIPPSAPPTDESRPPARLSSRRSSVAAHCWPPSG